MKGRGVLIPSCCKKRNEVDKYPASSLPGRSSERAKTGNQHPRSRSIANNFHHIGLSPKNIIAPYHQGLSA
jgi:hypothetical protein